MILVCYFLNTECIFLNSLINIDCFIIDWFCSSIIAIRFFLCNLSYNISDVLLLVIDSYIFLVCSD